MSQKLREDDNNQRKLVVLLTSVLLVSALLIIVAVFLQLKKTTDSPAPIYDILISMFYSIASSLIAADIVVYSSSKLLGEPLDRFIAETKSYIRQLSLLNESASRTGLVQVFPRRADYQEIFFDLLRTRWVSLDIMAVKMEFLARDPRFEDYLISGCKRGATIRILLIETENKDMLEERGKYEAQADFTNKALIAVSSYKTAIDRCAGNINCQFKLELRGHHEYLPITMMRIDDEMLYYSRTRSQRGADSPVYRVKKVPEGIFDIYQRDFDLLWNKYDPTVNKGET
jgi:hypothetical protein